MFKLHHRPPQTTPPKEIVLMQPFTAVHWILKELQAKLKYKKAAYPSKQLQKNKNIIKEIPATPGKIHPPGATPAKINHEMTVLVMIFPIG